jgi:hypothetical protein
MWDSRLGDMLLLSDSCTGRVMLLQVHLCRWSHHVGLNPSSTPSM